MFDYSDRPRKARKGMWEGVARLVPGALARRLASDSRATKLLRPFANRVLPAAETVVTVRSGPASGLRLPIFPRSEKYYWTGAHELHVQDAIASYLQPGMRFWDIGAHIGLFTALAARAVGPHGAVVAFEPMPANRERLLRTIRLNAASAVTVLDIAVAPTDGVMPLHANDATTMWTLVAERGETEAISVTARSLAALMSEYGAPDLIKVDAEGAEVAILESASEALRRALPALLVEFTDRSGVERVQAVLPEYAAEWLGGSHWMLQPERP